MHRLGLAISSDPRDWFGPNSASRHERYAARVRELVSDWCRLTRVRVFPGALFDRLICVSRPFPQLTPAGVPRLCADGSPIEVCERLARIPLGPAITCDLAQFGNASTRINKALIKAARTDNVIGAVDVARAVGEDFLKNLPSGANPAIWVGADCDAQHQVQVKLYFSVDGRRVLDIGSRCERALAAFSPGVAGRMRSTIKYLQAHGYVRMIALVFGPTSFTGAKVYARFKRVSYDDLRTLSDTAGVPFEPFDLYVRRVLRRTQSWFDARAGVGISLNTDGSPTAAALYHYPHGYFTTDEQLRTRLLEMLREFAWDPTAYRPVSRLLDASDGSRVRSLLAFGVSSQHGTVFHAYGRTGHLAA